MAWCGGIPELEEYGGVPDLPVCTIGIHDFMGENVRGSVLAAYLWERIFVLLRGPLDKGFISEEGVQICSPVKAFLNWEHLLSAILTRGNQRKLIPEAMQKTFL